MKKLSFLSLLVFSALALTSCGEDTATNVTETNVTAAKNLERSGKATVLSRMEYSTAHSDSAGSLQVKEVFNEGGNRVEYTTYDPGGSGEVFRQVNYEYNANDQMVKAVDGTITEEYTYNEKGNPLTRSIKGGPGEGGSQNNIYDNSGRLSESKHSDSDGNYLFSRVYEYKTNAEDSITEEKRYEKTADGTIKFQSHTELEYNPLKQVAKKIFYREKGEVYNYETYTYDNRGNLIEVKEFSAENNKMISKTMNSYNEWGELVASENYSKKNKLNFRTKYYYDELGTQIRMEYRHSSGEGWGERVVVEYGR